MLCILSTISSSRAPQKGQILVNNLWSFQLWKRNYDETIYAERICYEIRYNNGKLLKIWKISFFSSLCSWLNYISIKSTTESSFFSMFFIFLFLLFFFISFVAKSTIRGGCLIKRNWFPASRFSEEKKSNLFSPLDYDKVETKNILLSR